MVDAEPRERYPRVTGRLQLELASNSLSDLRLTYPSLDFGPFEPNPYWMRTNDSVTCVHSECGPRTFIFTSDS
jgi:hypothetical protein